MYQWLFFATLVANAPPASPPPPPTYISDRLSVSLHDANTPESPVLKQLIGGLPVKVLAREGVMVKIRTDDGSTGWVERDLITTDTPMYVLYLDLTERFAKAQEAVKALEQKIAAASSGTPGDESKIVTDLRTEIKNTLEHAVELEKHFRDNSKQVDNFTGRVRELEAENAVLQAQLAAKSTTVAVSREAGNFFPAGTMPEAPRVAGDQLWFLASFGLMFMLGGMMIGWFMTGRRLRSKASVPDRHA